MEKTPRGTAVGVDDPYAHVDRCDHLTDDGRCRFALELPDRDPEFARERAAADYACPVVTESATSSPTFTPESRPDGEDWAECRRFRCRTDGRECVRCGLAERRSAHTDERPLLEEHHLSYADDDRETGHEITVSLCRWCHAKVHASWARIDDDASPDPEAVAERETRVGRELDELAFEPATERVDDGPDDSADSS